MIKEYIQESLDLRQALLNNDHFLDGITEAIKNIKTALLDGHKILIAGNGGSAADAQHFAAELVGRYKLERKGYPAQALTTDSSVITAWSNDYDFNSIFSRQLEAFGRPGDLFFGISTSGNSFNIIQAVEKARKLGLHSVCLLGKDGGKLKDLADVSIVVPSYNTPRIQEIHIMLIHIMCEEFEKELA